MKTIILYRLDIPPENCLTQVVSWIRIIGSELELDDQFVLTPLDDPWTRDSFRTTFRNFMAERCEHGRLADPTEGQLIIASGHGKLTFRISWDDAEPSCTFTLRVIERAI